MNTCSMTQTKSPLPTSVSKHPTSPVRISLLAIHSTCSSAHYKSLDSATMDSMSSSIGAWTFRPVATDFTGFVLPNVGYWNVSNGTWEYLIQLAWPLNWTTPLENSTVETM